MSPCWDHRGQHRDLPRGYLAPWQNATFLVVGGYWHSYGTGSKLFRYCPPNLLGAIKLYDRTSLNLWSPATWNSPSSQFSNPFCACQCQDEILESFLSCDLACKSLCINSICRWSEPAGCLLRFMAIPLATKVSTGVPSIHGCAW